MIDDQETNNQILLNCENLDGEVGRSMRPPHFRVFFYGKKFISTKTESSERLDKSIQ